MIDFAGEFVAFAGVRRMGATLGLMLAGAAVEGLSLALLVPMLALLMQGGGGAVETWSNAAFLLGATTPGSRLAILGIAFLAAMTLRALVMMLRDRAAMGLQARYVEFRRLGLMRALAGTPWVRVAGLRHSRVTSALTNEMARVGAAAQSMMQIAVAAIMLAAQLALTLVVAWPVGLAASVLIAVGIGASASRLRRADHHGESLSKGGQALVHTAGQLLGGLKQAVAENRTQAFVDDFAATGAVMVERQIVYQRRTTGFHFVVSIGVAMAAVAVLLIGASMENDPASLLAGLVILSRMSGPAIGLQRDVETLATMAPAHRAIRALEDDLQPASPPMIANPSINPPVGAVTLDRVGFVHADGAGVRDVSVSISGGEIVGIVGPSGAGKTTLIDLIVGLLEPQTGEVRVGTIPLAGSMLDAWRKRVAYVGQDAFLADATLRQNLSRCGSDDETAMWDALSLAGIAGPVRAMPDSLDARLNDRGGRLSGGERQRIAIARAILRRPAMLVLDEATNAIDIETEDRILSALADFDPAMIILIVAHRRETLRRCTRVLTVEDGRLTADRAVRHRTRRPAIA